MKEQINQLRILENELQLNHDNVEVYVQNGLANETDLNTVKVEQLKAGQQRINLESNLEAYIQMLSVLTGEELNSDNVFIKPETESSLILPVINRPELKVFETEMP